MIDVLRILLDRLEASQRDIGHEQRRRFEAERQIEALQGRNADPREVIALLDHLSNGRKIDAVRSFRSLTGYGLKESKDAVESVTNRFAGAAP